MAKYRMSEGVSSLIPVLWKTRKIVPLHTFSFVKMFSCVIDNTLSTLKQIRFYGILFGTQIVCDKEGNGLSEKSSNEVSHENEI